MIGSTGLLATWAGVYHRPQSGSIAFFLLLGQLPAWVVGIVLAMVVSLSAAAFDSLQSAMVSTISNDWFRNRLGIWWVRAAVVVIIFPVVVLALKQPSILRIFLISDLVSSSVIPVLFIGLSDKFYWLRGFEVVVGGLGGILTVFIFGTIYFGSANKGANLILLEGGLYADDWSVFGKYTSNSAIPDLLILSPLQVPLSRLQSVAFSGQSALYSYDWLSSIPVPKLGMKGSTFWTGLLRRP
jgi:Na+/proline symporter